KTSATVVSDSLMGCEAWKELSETVSRKTDPRAVSWIGTAWREPAQPTIKRGRQPSISTLSIDVNDEGGV
ncbi:MAG: hypothetical protein U0223_18455, partial [Nitrospira sp.]